MYRSEIAKRTACSPETVRHYERLGLIDTPPPRRQAIACITNVICSKCILFGPRANWALIWLRRSS
jgi:hypothetical protein